MSERATGERLDRLVRRTVAVLLQRAYRQRLRHAKNGRKVSGVRWNYLLAAHSLFFPSITLWVEYA